MSQSSILSSSAAAVSQNTVRNFPFIGHSRSTYYTQVPQPGTYSSIPTWSAHSKPEMHATTILCVRKGKKVVVIGDGQVSMGPTIVKPNARKVRRIGNGKVIVGFAGATADAFTLVERLEGKLEEYPGQLLRAAVETAKCWRTDKYTRHLEALLIAADENISICLSGNGDVIESHDGLLGIGSGGTYALAAARALIDMPEVDALTVAKKVGHFLSNVNVDSIVIVDIYA